MGTFAYNIQVYAGGDVTEIRARLVEWIRRRVVSQGFKEAPSADRDGIDRVVTVGPADRGPWVSIYDDGGSLEDVAGDISKELGAPVVIIMVNDSDVLELLLFRDGAQIDHYNSYPDYNGEKLSKAQLAGLKGKPDLWAPFLPPGAEPRQLREAWDEKPLFAEDTLAATAELTGIDLDFALQNPDVLRFEGTMMLAFQLAERPAPRARFDGPPHIAAGFEAEKTSGEVGGALDMGLTARSMGGPSTGLDVMVWGDALEQGLVRAISATARSPFGAESFDAPLEPAQSQSGGREATVYTAHFADFAISQGMSGPVAIGVGTRGRRDLEAMQAAMFGVIIHCEALRVGQARVYVGLAPGANPDGQALVSTSLDISPPTRKPLHYDTAMPVLQYSRLMEKPTRLVGLVSLGMDQAACAEVAAAAIEAWHAAISPGARSKYAITILSQPIKRPRQQSVSADKFLASKQWSACRKELATCSLVSAAAPSGIMDPNAAPIDDGSGFTFGPGLHFLTPRDDAPSPHLCFWADLRVPGVDADGLESTLRAIIDDVVARAAGHQAFIARWDWVPRHSIDMTLYEIVTGIHGQCTTLTSWCSRFLRGVSDEMWLGSSLLERLGDRSGLAAVAALRPVGKALHLSLLPGASLDGLESALAPLLASTGDWQSAMQKMYTGLNPADILKQLKR